MSFLLGKDPGDPLTLKNSLFMQPREEVSFLIIASLPTFSFPFELLLYPVWMSFFSYFFLIFHLLTLLECWSSNSLLKKCINHIFHPKSNFPPRFFLLGLPPIVSSLKCSLGRTPKDYIFLLFLALTLPYNVTFALIAQMYACILNG